MNPTNPTNPSSAASGPGSGKTASYLNARAYQTVKRGVMATFEGER
jgi:cyclin-dependent kinase 8/11